MAFMYDVEAVLDAAGPAIQQAEEALEAGKKFMAMNMETAEKTGAKAFIDNAAGYNEIATSLFKMLERALGDKSDKPGLGTVHGLVNSARVTHETMNGGAM